MNELSSRLFYEDEYDALQACIGASGKKFKDVAHHLWPDMKPESAYAKLKNCVNGSGNERLSFGQVIAVMKFCGQYDPLYYACDESLHARPDRKSPEDQEARIVESIDKASHTLQRAMQELNHFRRIRGVT